MLEAGMGDHLTLPHRKVVRKNVPHLMIHYINDMLALPIR